MKPLSKQSLLWIILISWGTLFLAIHFFRPALPIEETRYLTVAWEMSVNHNYLIPHLNFLPYSHKPPLLFWLINLSWMIFGPTLLAARLIPLLFGLGTIYLTYRLAKILWPKEQTIANYSAFVLAGTLIFMAVSNIIMFDVLMTFWVMFGSIFLIQTLQQSSNVKYWFGFGLCLGFALLTKGPVAFVHMSIISLIAPLWFRDSEIKINWRRWYLGFFSAMILGVSIILAWAIPAAIVGGHDYAQQIFWSQSAGRVVNSFAHAKPFWFYAILLPFILYPWIWWPSFWKKMFKDKTLFKTWQMKYVLLWFLIVFVVFSCISGKQPHYMVPLLPPFALLFSAVISRLDDNRHWRLNSWFVLIVPIFIAAVVLSKYWLAMLLGSKTGTFLFMAPTWLGIVFAVMILICIYLSRYKGLTNQLYVSYFMAYVLVMGYLALRPLIERQDLAVLSQILQPYKNEVAFAQVYHGEIGFTAHLEKPIAEIEPAEIESWLAKHPKGIVVIKYDVEQRNQKSPRPILSRSHFIYETRFRGGTIGLIVYGLDHTSNKK